jgi:AmiR/NasT family two-component response regulator
MGRDEADALPEPWERLSAELLRHDTVQRAVGVLMETYGVDANTALDALVAESVRDDATLFVAAQRVIERLL